MSSQGEPGRWCSSRGFVLAQFDTSFLVLTLDSTMEHVKTHRALSDRAFKRSRLGGMVETGEGGTLDCPEQHVPMPTGEVGEVSVLGRSCPNADGWAASARRCGTAQGDGEEKEVEISPWLFCSSTLAHHHRIQPVQKVPAADPCQGIRAPRRAVWWLEEEGAQDGGVQQRVLGAQTAGSSLLCRGWLAVPAISSCPLVGTGGSRKQKERERVSCIGRG